MESGRNMAYLFQMYIVIEDSIDNVQFQSEVERHIEESLTRFHNSELVGSRICELGRNCGKCCKCGSWVSNQELDDKIEGFSDGCVINGEWWCDICLPHDNPKSFN